MVVGMRWWLWKLKGIVEMQWWVMRVGNAEMEGKELCELELKVTVPK